LLAEILAGTRYLIFDPEQMRRWQDYGHYIGQKNKPVLSGHAKPAA
jgi:hypothetical protein